MNKQFKRLAAVSAIGFVALAGVLASSATAGAPATDQAGAAHQQPTAREVVAKVAKSRPGATARTTSVNAAEDVIVEIATDFLPPTFPKCFDVVNASQANGADIQQYDCAGVSQQHFKVVSPDSEFTQLQLQHSGKCLDVRGGGLGNGVQYQQWDCVAGAPAQDFMLLAQSDQQAVVIVPRSTWESNALHAKCTDVRNGTSANGAKIQQWFCATTRDDNIDVVTAQRFHLFKVV